MAYATIEDMGLRKGLSSIRVFESAQGKPVARATGGKVTDLKVTDDGLRFTWKADGRFIDVRAFP